LKHGLLTMVAVLAVGIPVPAHGRDFPAQEPAVPAGKIAATIDAIAKYQGLRVHAIAFHTETGKPAAITTENLPQKAGEPLDRELVRESIHAIFATGRYADVEALAELAPGNQVDLTFVTSPNYFVGRITAEGAPARPTLSQIVDSGKLQLGELYTPEKMDRSLANIKRLLQDEGYYRAEVTFRLYPHLESQQTDVAFLVTPGPQASIGQVTSSGDSGYSDGQVQDIAKMHPGDEVSSKRITRALQRLRKKYQKQHRLLAQVGISERKYDPDKNVVNYHFQIDRGPRVELAVEGFKIRKSIMKKNVPIYEEGALDDDLLNEGRRNLLEYLQGRGYFDAVIGIKKHNEFGKDELDVVYTIDAGERHKLMKILITGNKYFDQQLLRSHLQIQAAGRFLSHGRFSQRLLAGDVRSLTDLYLDSGFRGAQVKSEVDDNYQGQDAQIAVMFHIEEGAQTLVGAVEFQGNSAVPQDSLPDINSAAGQPFSESKVAEDRDIILNYYLNHGFPNAQVDVAYDPSKSEPDRMNVAFEIHEGEQFFVNQVLVSGLEHTRPHIVNRELRVKPESALSQGDMLDTQRMLYDLGIFSQVDTAVQNPDGTESSKNVLVDLHEAKRYTFDYGVGFEFQTGQPSVGTNQPAGETGVSPRFAFGVTRLNFRGRDQTVTLKGNVGTLQQRGLISYDAPRWRKPNLRLSLTGFYDNTVDVTTFTSQRLEGSVQLEQVLTKTAGLQGRPISTMIYRFVYRRVEASNVVVASDQIPLLSQPTRVGMPGFTFIRDKRDNPLQSTRGNYTTFDGGVASSVFGSEANFGRTLFQNATYQAFGKRRPAGHQYVFARSTTIGLQNPFGETIILNPGQEVPLGKSVIPLAERFFSGGGNSHRGFALNQAGPRDPSTGFPLGGSAMFVNSLELRMPPVTLPYLQDNVSFTVFHDMGNVFTAGHDMAHSFLNWKQPNQSACQQAATASLCSYDYISQAIGIGVNYKTPVGPVRFDFGYNINPPAFPSFQTINNQQVFDAQRLTHFNFFISIGQAF
jgi:outer membrane protein assembly complex protein YaeT